MGGVLGGYDDLCSLNGLIKAWFCCFEIMLAKWALMAVGPGVHLTVGYIACSYFFRNNCLQVELSCWLVF